MDKYSSIELERIKKKEILEKIFKDYNKAVSNVDEIEKVLLLFKNIDKNKNEKVSVFGRVMTKRDMGKSYFLDVVDSTGRIQAFISRKALDEESIKHIDLLDSGDFININGTLMVTKTGQESIRVMRFRIITKSILPLPDKWHGLTNEEDLLRKRYLDLLLNKERRDVLIKRDLCVTEIRKFFKERKFHEVITPSLTTLSTGATARPFVTNHNALDIQMYLRIAPELYLKRLIGGNLGKVFEIATCFRNEGISYKHNPEFQQVEVYIANGDNQVMMKIVEDLVRAIVKKLWDGKMQREIKGLKFDFTKKFHKFGMNELVIKRTKYDFLNSPFDEAKAMAKELKINVKKEVTSNGLLLVKVFEELVEDTIMEPTFVYGYPIEVSPLAQINREDARIANRFEFFFAGMELANGYDEQNDYFKQKAAFDRQQQKKREGDLEANDYDSGYLEMLKHGLPPTGGLGMGIDRLIMILLEQKTIKNVIFFPALKQKKKV